MITCVYDLQLINRVASFYWIENTIKMNVFTHLNDFLMTNILAREQHSYTLSKRITALCSFCPREKWEREKERGRRIDLFSSANIIPLGLETDSILNIAEVMRKIIGQTSGSDNWKLCMKYQATLWILVNQPY